MSLYAFQLPLRNPRDQHATVSFNSAVARARIVYSNYTFLNLYWANTYLFRNLPLDGASRNPLITWLGTFKYS